MVNRRKQYLSKDVPIPSRTAYRRRKEAELAARALDETSESDTEQGQSDLRFFGVIDPRDTSSNDSVHSNDDSDANDENASMAEVMAVCSEDGEGGRELGPNCHLASDSSEISEGHNSNTEHSLSSDVIEEEQINSDAERVDSDRQSVVSAENEEDRPPQVPVGNGDENNHVERLLADRLCPCTPIIEGDAFLMCLALGIRHNLTWVAIVDLLKLINQLFGKDVIHASKYYLLKYFESGKESTVIHIYCPKCEAYLGTKDFVQEEEILHCGCGEAVKDLDLRHHTLFQ